MSNEKIEPPFTANKSLFPKLVSYNYKIKLKFEGNWLKQEKKAAFTPKKCGKVLIVYELDV